VLKVVSALLMVLALSLLFLFYGSPGREVVLSVRLPELLSTFAVGSILSLSGAVYQNTLRNPLAEPYTLGVASASALGAVVSVALGFRPEGGALLFSLLSLLLLLFAGRVFRSSFSILLFGVGLNALFSALILFAYAILPSYTLTDALYFTLGFITPPSLKLALFLCSISLIWLFAALIVKRPVELLPLGSEMAYFSGVNSERATVSLLLTFTVPVALTVSLFGIIGFVGIVIPHAVRLLGYRLGSGFILFTFLLGGGLLVLSQLIARQLLYPTLLPAGVITALLGAPAFIYLLWRYSGGRG